MQKKREDSARRRAAFKSNATDEQREAQRVYERNKKKQQLANETPEQRQARLQKMREYRARNNSSGGSTEAYKVIPTPTRETPQERLAARSCEEDNINEMQIKLDPEEIFSNDEYVTEISFEEQSKGGILGSHECDLCGISFPNIEFLLEHEMKDHYKIRECRVMVTRIEMKKEISTEVNLQSGNGMIEKKVNGPTYVLKKETKPHMKSEGSNEMKMGHTGGIICSQCGSVFTAREYLRTHLKAHHPETFYMFQVLSDENLEEIKSIDSEIAGNEDTTDDNPEKSSLNYMDDPHPEDKAVFTNLAPRVEIVPTVVKEDVDSTVDTRSFPQDNTNMDKSDAGEASEVSVAINAKMDLKNDACTSVENKTNSSPFVEISMTNISLRDGTNNKALTDISYRKGLFMCKICPYTSRDAGTLRGHIELHDEVAHNPTRREVPRKKKSLSCEKCYQIFPEKRILEKHKRSVHLDKRKYKCDSCEYACPRIYHLNMHKKSVHLKIRDWVCDVCGYAASLKQTLLAHVHLVHLKGSNSQCKEYEFTTSSRKSLKKDEDKANVHEETNSADSAVSVENNDFHEQSKVEDVTSNIKEWVCDMCEFVTSNKTSLVEHVHNNHWKDNFARATADEIGDIENIGAEGSAEGAPSITNDTI